MTQLITSEAFTDQSIGSFVSVLGPGDWRVRLAFIAEMMREMSLNADPESMVRTYGERMRTIMPSS